MPHQRLAVATGRDHEFRSSCAGHSVRSASGTFQAQVLMPVVILISLDKFTQNCR